MSDDHTSDNSENISVVSSNPRDRAWSRLKDSHDPRAFSEAWLEIQARQIGDGALCGVVVLGLPDQGPFEPVAVWPAGTLGSPVLAEAIEGAINKRQAIVKKASAFLPAVHPTATLSPVRCWSTGKFAAPSLSRSIMPRTNGWSRSRNSWSGARVGSKSAYTAASTHRPID